jgi:hypothetical protein
LWATIEESRGPEEFPGSWVLDADLRVAARIVLLDAELQGDRLSLIADGKARVLRKLQAFLFGDAIRLLEEAKSGLLRDSISRKKIDEAISKMVVVERPVSPE